MAGAGRCLAAAVLAALAASGAGCTYSSRTYPYEVQTVWQAAVGECVIWRSDRGIDEKNRTITSTRILLGGGELTYKLTVKPMPSLPSRPRTRVAVRIAQTKPTRERFIEEERRFLDQLGNVLRRVEELRMGG